MALISINFQFKSNGSRFVKRQQRTSRTTRPLVLVLPNPIDIMQRFKRLKVKQFTLLRWLALKILWVKVTVITWRLVVAHWWRWRGRWCNVVEGSASDKRYRCDVQSDEAILFWRMLRCYRRYWLRRDIPSARVASVVWCRWWMSRSGGFDLTLKILIIQSVWRKFGEWNKVVSPQLEA